MENQATRTGITNAYKFTYEWEIKSKADREK